MCRLLCSQLYWLSEAESLLHMYYPALCQGIWQSRHLTALQSPPLCCYLKFRVECLEFIVSCTFIVTGFESYKRSEGVVATGFLAAAVLDEVFIYEGGDVALDAFGRDAGGGGDLRDGVAGVGGDAGEDDALGGVDAGDGADDAVVEADD